MAIAGKKGGQGKRMRQGHRLPGSRFARDRRMPRGGGVPLDPALDAALVDGFPFGVLLFDAEARVSYANPAAAKLFDALPESLIGLGFADLAFVRAADGRQLKDLYRWARVRAVSQQTQFIRLGRVPGHPTIGTRVADIGRDGVPRFAVVLWAPTRTSSAEESLAAILDSATDPVLVVTDELTVHHANHAAADIFSSASTPLTGRPFGQLLAQPLTDADRRFLLGEESPAGIPRVRGHRIFRCRSADGIEFTAEGAISHTDHRDRRFHTIILRDVSARVAELERVRREMGLLRGVLENMLSGLTAYDADNRLVAFNPQFLGMFGFGEGEVHVGMSRDDLVRIVAARGHFGAGDPEEILRRRNAVWNSPRFAAEEVELANGRVLSIRRNRLPGGGAVTLFDDVTEQRRQAGALRDAMGRLQAASAVQAAIFDALPSTVMLLDRHGTIVTVNEAWRRFARETGLGTEDFVGSDYLEIARLTFTGPAEWAIDGIRDVLEGRRSLFSLEYACHAPDRPRWLIMLVAPVGGDQVSGAVVMHMDVTERKLAEQRVELSERRQRAIIESSGDAILTLDANGCILSGNPATKHIFGRIEQDLLSTHIAVLLPSFPFFQDSADFVPAVPPLFRGEFMGARTDGTRFPVDVVMSRVQDIFIVNIRDTSEQRTMQEQLVQASRLATLGEMAAGMAHELNQPLSVMRMAADNALMRIERGAANPAYLTEVLELVSGQCEKLGGLILNLRTFARREESAHRQTFNPVEAVQAACQLLHAKLALDAVEIRLDLPETCSPVRGSGNRLEQVVINLLSNAHDALLECRETRRGWAEECVSISVRDDPAEGQVRITVADSGCGIPPANLPKLFQPFFTTKGVGKGTGLGLSISYGIVTAMGGTITARNAERGGACFDIVLPTCDETDEADPFGEERRRAAGPLAEGGRK